MDALRDIIQPVTKNLPPPVRDAAVSLLGENCYEQLIVNVDLSNLDCVKLAISKGLGVAIVGVSAIVKVPQLINLLSSKSAAGISFLSYALETVAYLITLSYNVRMNNPFSTYGENVFIAIQNIAISALVLHFGGKSSAAAAFIAALGAGVYALFNESVVDMKSMAMLQAAAGAIGVASKLPQILAIWMEGGTGQLSSFAVFNFLFGSLTRIFTTLQEVNDPLILYGYVAGFALNLVLALQVLYYWNASPAKKPTPEIRVQSEKGESVPLATGSQARSTAHRRRA